MNYTSGLSLYVVFPDLYGIGEYNSENIEYLPIDNGAVFEDTYNEILDTASIKLTAISDSSYSRMEKLNVYDTALIYSSVDGVTFTLIRRMLVDKFNEKNNRTSSPLYHTFTIDLFSETKLLEKIILPNIAITQRKINQLSVADYIQQYVKEYSPYKRVKDVINGGYYPKRILSVSSETISHFGNILVKDMQLNKPTLRQAITELMLIDDCIPVLSNGVISYISLSTRLSDISNDENIESQFNHFDITQNEQDSSEYANEMNITLDNVTNNEQTGIDNLVNVCEMIGFRNDASYILQNPNNLRITTQYPIYNDPKIIMCFNGYYYDFYSGGGQVGYLNYYEYDISKIISEYSNWLKKPIFVDTWYSGTKDFSELIKYKNTSLYYTRGNNYIEGFDQKINFDFLGTRSYYQISSLYSTIGKTMEKRNSFLSEQAVNPIEFQKFSGLYDYGDAKKGRNLSMIGSIYFKIQYQTLASIKARIGKHNQSTNFIESIDNQTSSYSDSDRVGVYEYSKTNRIGNKTKIMSGRFTDYSNIPSLAQTYGDYVIYKRSIKFDKHQYIVDIFLTENYILKDYFTGVSSKIRSWAIAQGKEALERHDIIKNYFEFSFNKKNEAISYQYLNSLMLPCASLFSSAFSHLGTINTVNNALIQTIASADETNSQSIYPSSLQERYNVEEENVIFGDSILFTFGFNDNFIAGRYISTDENTDIGGWGQSDYPYVNNFGENKETDIGLCGYIDPSNGFGGFNEWNKNGSYLETLQQADLANQTSLHNQTTSWNKPLAYNYSRITKLITCYLGNHKDNREITRVTTQIEFCSDSNNIVFGKQFIKRQSVLNYLLETNENYKGELISLDWIDSVSFLKTNYSSESNQYKYAIVGGNILFRYILHSYSNKWYWELMEGSFDDFIFSYGGNNYQFHNGDFIKMASSYDFNIYGFYSSQFNSNKGEPILPSGGTKLTTAKIAIENSSDKLSYHLTLSNVSSSYVSFAICDYNDNVILAWNGSASAGVWLNQKVIRDDYVYDPNDSDSKVGTIVVS